MGATKNYLCTHMPQHTFIVLNARLSARMAWTERTVHENPDLYRALMETVCVCAYLHAIAYYVAFRNKKNKHECERKSSHLLRISRFSLEPHLCTSVTALRLMGSALSSTNDGMFSGTRRRLTISSASIQGRAAAECRRRIASGAGGRE